jgi:cell division septal protein FtsQ
MAREPALAVPRPRTLPTLRGTWRRAAIVAVFVLGGLGLLYLGARETPVFALRTIEVSGAPANVRAEVLGAVAGLRGQSLVSLDGDALVQRLEALPTVQSAAYDRAFPNTLRLTIEPEQPVGVLVQGRSAWVVSVSGRVIESEPPTGTDGLARVRDREDGALHPGATVPSGEVRAVLGVLAQAPKRMPLPIRSGRLEDGELTFVLAGAGGSRPLLELGEPTDAWVKLRVAALVLRKLSPEEGASLGYLDVSLPDRPVVSSKSQPSG